MDCCSSIARCANRPSLQELSLLDILAIVLRIVGFFFEAVGDWQLSRYKANPANLGKVMRFGVWRYTRHPNYFGDSAQWWGYYFFALSVGGWWSIFSPIIMTILLMKVSGVALLGKTLKEEKPGYKDYIEIASGFILWFPRHNKT